MKIGKYDFKQTCSACPEQYDVFDEEGQQVAYVRLRWGSLYAECPDVGGTSIYSAEPPRCDGCFKSNEQRFMYLRKIAKRIALFNQPVNCPNCGGQHKLNEHNFDILETEGMVDVDCTECDNYFMVHLIGDNITVSEA